MRRNDLLAFGHVIGVVRSWRSANSAFTTEMGAKQTLILRIRDLRIGSNSVDEPPPRIEAQRRSAYASAVAPLRAASIAAMSILRMVIMASIARRAASRLGSAMASSSARGVICQEKPHRSRHQPQ